MAKNIETIESLLSTIPIEGPRLIITKDTKEIYYRWADAKDRSSSLFSGRECYSTIVCRAGRKCIKTDVAV